MRIINKNFIIPAILGVAILLLIVFVIYPIFKDIEKNSSDFISLKGEFISLKTDAQNLQEAKRKIAENEQNLAKINALFIDPEVPIDFVRFLEKLAADTEVSIKINFTPVLQNQGNPWPALSFFVSAKGNFQNFSRFIDKLENAPYLIRVQNLTSKPQIPIEEGKSLDGISADINFIVFTR